MVLVLVLVLWLLQELLLISLPFHPEEEKVGEVDLAM